MSVRKESRRDSATGEVREFWMVDVDLELPSGKRQRVRKVSPVQTKRGAEQYERELREQLLAGTHGRKEVQAPLVKDFAKEFLDTYAAANNKPSEVAAKTSHLNVHLLPVFGELRLDEVGAREIERYKAQKLKEAQSPKSINNHLTVLRRLLGVAVEFRVLGELPRFKLLKVPKQKFDFLDFAEAERLVAAAAKDPELQTEILVALRCGLRHGELHALRWGDVDLVAGRLVVRRSLWRKQFVTPKNGLEREIPLGDDVLAALKRHRHLRGELVFGREDGGLRLATACKWPLWGACKWSGLRPIQWHVLRHSFASQLVMRGAPLKAVQELMGHATIEMTMRYAHLAPTVRRDVVKLLDVQGGGNLTATGASGSRKPQQN